MPEKSLPSLFNSGHAATREALDKYGYSILDLIDPKTLTGLQEAYRTFQAQIDASAHNGIHMTTWVQDKAIKYQIRDELEKLLKPSCERVFHSFKMLNTVFIVKNKHKVSDFPLHQDWSFVDESKHQAINVWIALQDTNIRNGGLYVIAGSHRLNNLVRGAGKLSFDFSAYQPELMKLLTPVRLKAGQAVLFYYSTIHGSPANTTGHPRVVVATTIVPEAADLLINYFDEPEQALLQFQVPDNFTYEYEDIRNESMSRRPAGKLIHTISKYTPVQISLEDIQSVAIQRPTIFHTLLAHFKK